MYSDRGRKRKIKEENSSSDEEFNGKDSPSLSRRKGKKYVSPRIFI